MFHRLYLLILPLLQELDREWLRVLLIALGLAAVVLTVVLLVVHHLSLIILLLAALGGVTLWQLWNRFIDPGFL